MLSSTSEYECTRTFGDRMERFTEPPEMMQPSDTSESVALPTRLLVWSAKTNLAGAPVWLGAVKMGHSSL